MKLCVSQIAWTDEQDDHFLGLIGDYQFNHIELVPSRFGNNLKNITDIEIENYLSKLKGRSLTPLSMQGLLFGGTELHLFNSPETRKNLESFMLKAIENCAKIGVKNMVFGSPKNRNYPEELNKDEALTIAKDFFFKLGEKAKYEGVSLGLEPNAKEYGTNFLINTFDTLAFVRDVNSEGLKCNVDLSTMKLAGEDFSRLNKIEFNLVSHLHLSTPYLKTLDITDDSLKEIFQILRSKNYNRGVSIEMGYESIEATELTLKRVSEIFYAI